MLAQQHPAGRLRAGPAGALERLVERAPTSASVLYVNQVERNFRMLRFAEPVHVQLGHGESDKAGSVSNQHKAYDLTFVGGPAGRDRLGAALRGFDADVRTVQVGRPQLDHESAGAPDWADDGRLRVLYAPTWEGDRARSATGRWSATAPRSSERCVPTLGCGSSTGPTRGSVGPPPRTVRPTPASGPCWPPTGTGT